MASLILSPHFDDAVLSCWRVLEAGGEVTVVNVFTASPPSGRPSAWWDRLTGARDSIARMAERRAEDQAALALAGCEALSLGLLDDQYRTADIETGKVLERLRGALAPGSELYAPAAMDEHRDHVLVRDAALSLAGEGWPLVLYADLPHATGAGWPSWVSGMRKRPGSDPDAIWDRALDGAGLALEELTAYVRPLEPAARARKLAAVDCYRTQREALDRFSFAPLADPRALAWEVYWRVPPSAVRDPHQPGRQDRVVDALGQASHHGG
jgi:LmbE family N-acetylglucosaminyl deacetylase